MWRLIIVIILVLTGYSCRSNKSVSEHIAADSEVSVSTAKYSENLKWMVISGKIVASMDDVEIPRIIFRGISTSDSSCSDNNVRVSHIDIAADLSLMGLRLQSDSLLSDSRSSASEVKSASASPKAKGKVGFWIVLCAIAALILALWIAKAIRKA